MTTDRTSRAMALVIDERFRQEDLKASGRFAQTCADPGVADALRLSVLLEEVDEALAEMPERHDPRIATLRRLTRQAGSEARRINDTPARRDRLPARGPEFPPSRELIDEVVQVAAVALAWLEGLLAEREQVTP